MTHKCKSAISYTYVSVSFSLFCVSLLWEHSLLHQDIQSLLSTPLVLPYKSFCRQGYQRDSVSIQTWPLLKDGSANLYLLYRQMWYTLPSHAKQLYFYFWQSLKCLQVISYWNMVHTHRATHTEFACPLPKHKVHMHLHHMYQSDKSHCKLS